MNLAVEEQAWVYARVLESSVAIAALNNAGEAMTLDLDVSPAGLADGAVLRDRLGMAPDVRIATGRLRLALPPRSGAIYVPAGE
jgi:hypothetical protein